MFKIFLQTLLSSPELTNALLGACIVIVPLVGKLIKSCIAKQIRHLDKDLQRNTRLTERALENIRATKAAQEDTKLALEIHEERSQDRRYAQRGPDPYLKQGTPPDLEDKA